MTPYGVLASSASARRCSLLRPGSRGDAAMRPEVPESLTGDCRVADKGVKNRSERAISSSTASRSRHFRGMQMDLQADMMSAARVANQGIIGILFD